MGAGAPRQEAEAVLQAFEVRPERVRHTRLEPADHPRAPAAEDDPALPGLAEDRVEPVHAPDGEHVGRVAASDVEDVPGERVLAQVGARPRVERDPRHGRAPGPRLEEARRRRVALVPRRPDPRDAGTSPAGEPDDEALERRAEREAAHGDDVALRRHPVGRVWQPLCGKIVPL